MLGIVSTQMPANHKVEHSEEQQGENIYFGV